MRYTYPQPGNDDEFEDFCVRYYRHLLKRSGLYRYGKRGSRQHGIDIIDQHGLKPFIAIQCKQHEHSKPILPSAINAEVSKAETSSHPIETYIIATTAQKTTAAQDAVVQLNQRSQEIRRFTVEIHFWEDICTQLSEFGRAVADSIIDGVRSPEELVTVTGSHFAAIQDSPPETAEAVWYGDIDELFTSRKLEAAEHEISKLPDPEHDSTLNERQRYAILRLRAKLAAERSNFDEAARLFNLAYSTCPNLQQAQQNRALALELAGERKQAFTEAKRLLDDGVRSSFLLSLFIRNSDTPADLAPYQEVIDEYTSSAEDVNLALVDRHVTWNDLNRAECDAKKALDIAAESAHALFSHGMVSHRLALQGDWRNRFDRLREAISFYSKALTAAERGKFSGLLPEIHSNRGRANAALNDRAQAAADFRSAVRVADNPRLYAPSAVSFFLHGQDFESARELTPLLDQASDEAAFLRAVIDHHFAPDQEKREHAVTLERVADRKTDRETEARFICVEWALDLKDFDLARKCVPESFIERKPLQARTLLAWTELEAGNEGPARESALLAFDSSSRAANKQELSVLGRLLARLHEEEKALPLFEQAATPGVLDEDCKRLLDFAQQLDRHDILMRVCSELTQTNQHNKSTRKLEVQVLSHYAPDRAFLLAKESLQYDEPYFSAVTNYLAVRLGRPGEIRLDENKLPSPTEFGPDDAYLIVTPYIELGRYRDALQFAYHQLRIHCSDERANGQYIAFVLQYGDMAGIPHLIEAFDQQSAARLENLITNEQRWVVAEDQEPDLTRNEYSCSSSVVQAIIDKRVGDTVDLRGPAVQTQQERIVAIQSKYVRLFQDAILNFQIRFPDSGAIQSLNLLKDGKLDLTPLIESHKARREHAQNAIEFYRDFPCSLHVLASRLGTNEHEIVIGLTADNESFVHCAMCAPKEFSEIAAAGFDRNKVVLDLSAIITISRLRAWDKLDAETIEYSVSQGTFDQITEWLHSTETGGQPVAYSFLRDDGMIGFQGVTPEQLNRKRVEIETIVAGVSARCAVKSSITLANLDPKRREQYIKICGLHTLESASLAAEENALLWTDDLFVAMLGEAEFGVRRIWTQLAFKVLENTQRITNATYSEITAKLAAWNYAMTIWKAEDVISAGNLCEWDISDWPLKQCIALLGKCPTPPQGKVQIAFEFFRLLRQSACGELRKSSVVQAILDALGNTSAVEWMLRQVDQVFRVDVLWAASLKVELAYWLRLR